MAEAGDKEMVDFLVFHMNRLQLELTGEASSMVERTLFEAIKSHQTDSDMLISLLKVITNFDFNQIVSNAAKYANEHFFMKLVSSYPDEFQKRVGGLDGTEWLCSACRGDSISIIEYLTKQGASPVKLNVMGDIDVEEEPLFCVKSAKALDILLKHGVKDHLLSPRIYPVSLRKREILLGDLGFSQSFEFNDIEMFNIMVKWNGKLSSHVVELALDLSLKEELKQLVLTQLSNKNIVEPSFDGYALYSAVSKGQTGFVKALIDGTPDGILKYSLNVPNLSTDLGFKAAHCSNNIEMLQLLFESNLILCCNTLFHEIVLFESERMHKSSTIICNIGKVLNLLLQKGADINSLSSEGKPALCQAAGSRSSHLVSDLIGLGADVNVVWNGKSPLSLILEHGIVKESDIQKILIKGGRISSEESLFAVHGSIVTGDFETTRDLIEVGGFNPVVMNRSNVFCRTSFGNLANILSPLCMALICCEFAIADHFINIGYLTESDVKLLPTHPELDIFLGACDASDTFRDLIYQKLDSLSSIVPSMFKLAFHKLSNVVGSQPLREKKVKELEIPVCLQKALMFRDPGCVWPKCEDTGDASEDIRGYREFARDYIARYDEDDESEYGDGSENSLSEYYESEYGDGSENSLSEYYDEDDFENDNEHDAINQFHHEEDMA